MTDKKNRKERGEEKSKQKHEKITDRTDALGSAAMGFSEEWSKSKKTGHRGSRRNGAGKVTT